MRGLLVERPAAEARSGGRPPTLLTLDRSIGIGIGIDVRHVAVAVGNPSRAVHAERWWPEPAGHTALDGIATVVSSVETALREAGAEREQTTMPQRVFNTLCEAQDATLTGSSAATDHNGYTGIGFGAGSRTMSRQRSSSHD